MGEGIFLLVIKALFDDIYHNNNKKGFKRKSKQPVEFVRYTEYINNTPFYILELNRSFVNSVNVQRLLSGFKGRVVINESIESEIFNDFLFDATDYNIRALLSSLLNVIRNEGNIRSVYINLNHNSNDDNSSDCFCSASNELYLIVKLVKDVNIIFKSNRQFQEFREICYNRFGTIINSFECDNVTKYDLFISMKSIEKDGKCEMYLNGNNCFLYPDWSYYEVDDNVRKLLLYGVGKNIACAICNSKKT